MDSSHALVVFPRSRARRALVAVLVLWAVLLTLAISAPSPAVGATIRFRAVADARVHELFPTTNYGRRALLKVSRAPGKRVHSYLRFSAAAHGNIEKVTLRLFAASGTNDGPLVYSTPSRWRESSVAWSGRPRETSEPLDDAGRIRARTWVDLDVTEGFSRDGSVSFVLIAESTDAVAFKSRETRRPPKLIVTTSIDGPMSPPASSPPASSSSPTPSPTRSPSPSPSRSFSPTPIPPSGDDVLIAAAGDIACDPDDE